MPTTILDDHGPSFVYSSGWRTGGSATEQNGTTMYTNIGGATATVSFKGVGITISGTVAGNSTLYRTPPKSSYQLDENEPVFFQPSGIAPQQRYPFYQSPQLSNKQHTLVVTNIINGSIILVLDYATITTGSEDKATTGSSPSPTSPHIVGPVVGAIACFLLLVFGVFYFWRRRKRQLEDNQNSSLVPSVWTHSSATYGLPPGPNKLASSSSSSSPPPTTTTITSTLPPSKGMPSIQVSLPAPSNHVPLNNESDIPQVAPPSYTVAVCMVTSTG